MKSKVLETEEKRVSNETLEDEDIDERNHEINPLEKTG